MKRSNDILLALEFANQSRLALIIRTDERRCFCGLAPESPPRFDRAVKKRGDAREATQKLPLRGRPAFDTVLQADDWLSMCVFLQQNSAIRVCGLRAAFAKTLAPVPGRLPFLYQRYGTWARGHCFSRQPRNTGLSSLRRAPRTCKIKGKNRVHRT